MKEKHSISLPSQRARAVFIWGGLATIITTVFYLGSNEIASRNANFYQLYFDFERNIPMVPWMIYIYNSFVFLILLNCFVLKSHIKIKALSIGLIASSTIGAIFFLLFPAELGFSRIENIKGYEFWYETLHMLDHPHNLAPSLHITYSTLSGYVLATNIKSKFLKGIILLWVLLISSSIVLVHQHHLFDIFSGAILALVVKYLIYDKLISTANNAA